MMAASIQHPPARVFVPHGKKPPRGVLWADGEALLYHAARARYSRALGCDVPAEPARLGEFRQVIRDYVQGRCLAGGWDYYKGRRIACPYRCSLDSATCPVDVLVEEINKPRPVRHDADRQIRMPQL